MRLLIVCAIFMLGSCTTGDKIRSGTIQPGISTAKLEQYLGHYDGYREQDGYKVLTYKNRLISGWAYEKTDYHFIFKGDKLSEWGSGEIRNNQNTGMLFIYSP